MPKFALFAASLLMTTAVAASPLRADVRSGRYCKAIAPADWSFTAENPSGNAFGADLRRADGGAVVSYFIVGVPPEMRASPQYARWYATPQPAAMATLSQMGTTPVQCAAPTAPAAGLNLMQRRTPQLVGLAMYQVFPMANNGYVLVMHDRAVRLGQVQARQGQRRLGIQPLDRHGARARSGDGPELLGRGRSRLARERAARTGLLRERQRRGTTAGAGTVELSGDGVWPHSR